MSHTLVVDDDSIARAILRVILERTGHSVTEAQSVREASALLGSESFDAIVCDYLMADGTGLELLDAYPEVAERFVLLTGVTERAQLTDERADLVAAYLTKPVGSEALIAVLQEIASGSAAA